MAKFLKSVLPVLFLGCMAASLAVAAPASAAPVFCKENVSFCSAEDVFPIGTSFSASLWANPAGSTMITTWSEQECTGSTMEWETTGISESTGKLVGTLTGLSFEGCKAGTSPYNDPCIGAEAMNLPWAVEFDNEASASNRFTVDPASNPTIRRFCQVNQFSKWTCVYGWPTFGMEGSAVYVDTMLYLWEGLACSEPVRWLATYAPISPEAFLTEG